MIASGFVSRLFDAGKGLLNQVKKIRKRDFLRTRTAKMSFCAFHSAEWIAFQAMFPGAGAQLQASVVILRLPERTT